MSDTALHCQSFISGIQKELKNPLPGRSFQYKMAPDDRDRQYEKNTQKKNPKQAGVMLLLFPSSGRLSTVFVKRTVYTGAHSGQISFPGGTYSSKDSSLLQTAVRETQEELGIELTNMVKLGALTPLFISVSNFMVYPYVGFINETPVFKVQPSEVQYAFIEGLSTFQDKKIRNCFELKRENYSLTAPCYFVHKEKIWGATAMILSEFLEILQRSGINLKL